MRELSCAALLLSILATTACADEFCGWRPREIPDPRDIRGTSLVLTDGRSTFGVYNKCLTLDRSQFGSELNFGIVNRFPAEMSGSSGYLLIKSIRTFSNTPPIRFSLSRGGGWFLQGNSSTPAPAKEMKRVPYRSTIAAWNAAHSQPDSPAALGERLHVAWHAYTDQDASIASSGFPEFWRVDEAEDEQHTVITNYLIHFDLNTDSRVKLVPFQVGLQEQVSRFEIHIVGDPDSLAGDYTFIVK